MPDQLCKATVLVGGLGGGQALCPPFQATEGLRSEATSAERLRTQRQK